MWFIQRYKNNLQTYKCKNRSNNEIYYFSSINTSESSHWGMSLLILSSGGALSASVLRYTVQKHEVFNGLFSPMCQDRQGSCCERRLAAFDSAAHSSPRLIIKISATSYTDKQREYIHCSANGGLTNSILGDCFELQKAKIVHWKDKATFQTRPQGSSNVSTLKWLWLSKAVTLNI